MCTYCFNIQNNFDSFWSYNIQKSFDSLSFKVVGSLKSPQGLLIQYILPSRIYFQLFEPDNNFWNWMTCKNTLGWNFAYESTFNSETRCRIGYVKFDITKIKFQISVNTSNMLIVCSRKLTNQFKLAISINHYLENSKIFVSLLAEQQGRYTTNNFLHKEQGENS